METCIGGLRELGEERMMAECGALGIEKRREEGAMDKKVGNSKRGEEEVKKEQYR